MVNPKKEWERSDNLNRLLSLLTKHGELSFGDLNEKMGVSEPTLTNYIKTLEKQKKIEPLLKPQDRRQRWYRIKPENRKNVETQLGKYEAIKFIEGIPNPIYSYHQDKNGQRAIAAFISRIDQRIDGLAKKAADQLIKRYLTLLVRLATLLPNQKIAVVLMVKGKEGVES